MDDQQDDGEQSKEYDPFAEIKMKTPEMQECWYALGEVYYHYVAGEFLEPLTVDDVGEEVFEAYEEEVKEPMCINWVKQKMEDGEYPSKYEFIREVFLIFDNCMLFNETDSDVYQSALELKFFFK